MLIVEECRESIRCDSVEYGDTSAADGLKPRVFVEEILAEVQLVSTVHCLSQFV